MGAAACRRPTILSDGGGLVSTAADYHRFAQFLLRHGELDGVRLLSPRTVDRMISNHLPGGHDLEQVGRPVFAESPFHGVGFGLGVSVVLDQVKAKSLGCPGEFGWGGAASTAFFVDPAAGNHRVVLHAAATVEHPSDPARTEPTGVFGAGG